MIKFILTLFDHGVDYIIVIRFVASRQFLHRIMCLFRKRLLLGTIECVKVW